RQHPRCPLHAVAQPHMGPTGRGDSPTVDRHRIGIVEEKGIGRAQVLHLATKIKQDRYGTEAAENAAWSQRITYTLTHPEARGDLNIGCVGIQPPYLNGDDYKARATHRLGAVERSLDPCAKSTLGHHRLYQVSGQGQPPRVDVHQANRTVLQGWERQYVIHQVSGKHDTAGADQGDLYHDSYPSTSLAAGFTT